MWINNQTTTKVDGVVLISPSLGLNGKQGRSEVIQFRYHTSRYQRCQEENRAHNGSNNFRSKERKTRFQRKEYWVCHDSFPEISKNILGKEESRDGIVYRHKKQTWNLSYLTPDKIRIPIHSYCIYPRVVSLTSIPDKAYILAFVICQLDCLNYTLCAGCHKIGQNCWYNFYHWYLFGYSPV